VLSKTALRRTSAEFVAFLGDIVAHQPKRRVISDNLSAHNTKRLMRSSLSHSNVHLHYTPTYSSPFNQVELRFAKSSATSSPAACSPHLVRR
jgi:transposase